MRVKDQWNYYLDASLERNNFYYFGADSVEKKSADDLRQNLFKISTTLTARNVKKDKFGLFYDAVVQKIQSKGAKVILVTPAVIGERNDQSNPQDGELNLYAKWIRQYAAQKQLTLVDCRKLFLDYSIKNNPKQLDKGFLTYDRVHLNDAGNQLVADAIWEAIK